jgi:hypothetical protein
MAIPVELRVVWLIRGNLKIGRQYFFPEVQATGEIAAKIISARACGIFWTPAAQRSYRFLCSTFVYRS